MVRLALVWPLPGVFRTRPRVYPPRPRPDLLWLCPVSGRSPNPNTSGDKVGYAFPLRSTTSVSERVDVQVRTKVSGELSMILHDLRHAFRQLIRVPGFTVTAIVTLALGIGANSAIFSVVNAVLRHPAGVDHPERVAIQNTSYKQLGMDFPGVFSPTMRTQRPSTTKWKLRQL